MAGTKQSAAKAALTNQKKYGPNYYKVIGQLGGKADRSTPRGFAAMSPEEREAAGRKGGSISRRTR